MAGRVLAVSELEPGTAVGDRYRVVRWIGAGTVGTVHEVEHVGLRVRFAMKLMSPRLFGVPGAAERFHREARSVAGIDDPRIVRVTDFGHHEGRPFLVMERLEGQTLGAAWHAGAIDPRGLVELMIDVLEGLAAAHARGLVHRDIKPENLFVVRDALGRRRAKILDFGLVKLAQPEDAVKTAQGAVFGTPRYMAPEQATGDEVDRRTDLYAVAVILHELLSGEPPFSGRDAAEVLRQHIVASPPPLTVNAPGLDGPRLAAAVASGLAKRREERPTDAAAFAAALAAALEGPKTKRNPPDLRWLGPVAAVGMLLALWAWPNDEPTIPSEPSPEPPPALVAEGPQPEAPPEASSEEPEGEPADVPEEPIEPKPSEDSASVESLLSERDPVALRRAIRDLETDERQEAGSELASIARGAPTFALRRQAYEALEARNETRLVGPLAFLTEELAKNATDSCELRRWYVARIAALRIPSTRPLLVREKERRGGFLDLDRKGGCLDPVVNPALAAFDRK